MKWQISRVLTALLALLSLQFLIPQSAIAAETLDYTYTFSTPQDAVFSPDGASLWVLGSSNLYQYSTSTHALLNTVALSSSAQHLAITPDGSKIYAALYVASGVAVVNTATATRTSVISIAANPFGIAASPDGSFIYVAQASGNLQKISTSTDAVVSSVVLSGSGSLRDLEVSPDGNTLYVCDNTNRSMVKVNSSDLATVSTLVLAGSSFVTLSADGSYGFAAPYTGVNIYKFSTAAMTLTSTISGFSSPGDSEFSKDGQYIYVSNASTNTISKVRLSDGTIVSTITPGLGTTWHVALEPSGNFLYIMATSGKAFVYNLGNPPTLTLSFTGTVAYRASTTLTAAFSANTGTVTFYANGKYISKCAKIAVQNSNAICTYRPNVRGAVNISARAVNSTDTVTASKTLLVVTRTSKR